MIRTRTAESNPPFRQWIIPVGILVMVFGPIAFILLLPDGDECLEYLSEVDAPLEGYMNQTGRIIDEPLVLASNEWRQETAVHIVEVHGYIEKMRRLDPPPSVEPLHEIYLEALDALEDSTEAFIHGVDNVDTESFRKAETDIIEYGRLLEEMQTASIAICE